MARGIPTAAELAEALADFLTDEVMPETHGRLQFHARVARNVAAILERELRHGEAWELAHAARLAELGVRDDAQLAQEIRAGDFDGNMVELCRILRASTVEELRIMNPRRLDPRDQR